MANALCFDLDFDFRKKKWYREHKSQPKPNICIIVVSGWAVLVKKTAMSIK